MVFTSLRKTYENTRENEGMEAGWWSGGLPELPTLPKVSI
jgi:hypothetical protein